MDETVVGSLKMEFLGGTLVDEETGHELVIDANRRTVGAAKRNVGIIGRNKACDLVVDDGGVSAMHLEVTAVEGAILVRDLDSRNGLWIAGTRVPAIYLTKPASFKIGRRTLVFTPGGKAERALPGAYGSIRAASSAMREVFDELRLFARGSGNIHLTGESGVGKTYFASILHEHSARSKMPFIVVDLASTPPSLIESSLFGHVKGAFTGADRAVPSPFVQAEGGTVFVDELGELSDHQQRTLLRVLDEKIVQAVGSARPQKVDVRIVTATNRDLRAMVNEGRFRKDLFFRLGQRIRIPSLRDRLEDLEFLVERILRDMDRSALFAKLPSQMLHKMREYTWPGNVRELRDLVIWIVEMSGEHPDLDFDHTAWFRNRDATDNGGRGHGPRAKDTFEPTSEPELHALWRLIHEEASQHVVLDEVRRIQLAYLHAKYRGNVSEIARRAGISPHTARAALARLNLRAIEPSPRDRKRKDKGR